MRLLTLGGRQFDSRLRALGHAVRHAGEPGTAAHPDDREIPFLSVPGSVRPVLRALAEDFRPDWILLVDDSTPLPHIGLEDLPFKKAWYAIDSHLHADWHRHLAPLFDLVFVAQRNRIADLGEFRGGDAEWLPLAFGSEPEFLPWHARSHGACFVGSLDPVRNPARMALLEGLKARGMEVLAVQGEFPPIYRAARVVINQSVHDDLNQRVFEAMGCGALLITDRISHSLEDIGEPGRDFLVYPPGDAGELARLIRAALDHPDESAAMARRGHERVLASHLVGHRVDRLLEAFAREPSPPRPTARVLGHLAAALEHVSRLALPDPLPAFFADEARRAAFRALEADPRSPWARLVLATRSLDAKHPVAGLDFLDGVAAEAEGPRYHRRYALLRILLLAHAGRIDEARREAASARRALPEDPDLAGAAKVLGIDRA